MSKKPLTIFSKDLGPAWEKEVILDKENESLHWIVVFDEKIPETVNLTVRLAGRGSRFVLHSMFLGRQNQKCDINLVIRHEAPETYGRVHFRSAMFDASRLTFRGLIRIEKEAQGADSYLEARALMLSPKSMAHVFPYLEIEANEVRASHGASIGRLDERNLFYLQSRGLIKSDIQNILLEGYFGTMFAQLPGKTAAKLKALLQK